MSNSSNSPNKVIIRPYDRIYWLVIGVNSLTGQEEIYLTGMDLDDAEKVAQNLADRYGIPIVKEER